MVSVLSVRVRVLVLQEALVPRVRMGRSMFHLRVRTLNPQERAREKELPGKTRTSYRALEVSSVDLDSVSLLSGVSPTEVAIHEARRMHRAWLRTIIGDLNVPEARLDANGRLAFLLCDGPNRYPDYFIGEGEAPQELIDAMRKPIEQSGPDLAFSSMVPRPIDLGPMAEREHPENGFFDSPWLRYLTLAAFASLVIWGLYQITR